MFHIGGREGQQETTGSGICEAKEREKREKLKLRLILETCANTNINRWTKRA